MWFRLLWFVVGIFSLNDVISLFWVGCVFCGGFGDGVDFYLDRLWGCGVGFIIVYFIYWYIVVVIVILLFINFFFEIKWIW